MVTQQDFRQAMAAVPAAVNVITTHGPAGCHGMTATAVCSVTDEPASLLVCINKSARMHDVLCRNGRFCVNVLAAGQDGVSAAFSARDLTIDDRLAAAGSIAWLDHGVPALAEARIALACRVTQLFEVGTHTVFIGAVEQLLTGSGAGSLAYFERGYRHLEPSAA